MTTKQLDYIQEQKSKGHTWAEITNKFNSIFTSSYTPNAVRKGFKRGLVHIDEDSLVNKAVKIIKTGHIRPTELGRRLNLDLDGLEKLLDELLADRVAIKYHNNSLIFDNIYAYPDNKKHKMDISLESGKWYKIGIMADTHCCSVQELPHLVEKFYSMCYDEGVIAMLHAGDVFCGNGTVYRGQFQDIKILGVDRQLEYVSSIYPSYPFPTYMISGNHDLDCFRVTGVDIVSRLCDMREDLYYLGKMGGYINIGDLNCYLLHGDAGSTITRTFKLQKIIDNIPQDSLPDVLILGHYHTVALLPNYRGVIGIQPASFESQSEFLTRKGLYPEIGGIILNVLLVDVDGKKRIARSKFEFINLNHYL